MTRATTGDATPASTRPAAGTSAAAGAIAPTNDSAPTQARSAPTQARSVATQAAGAVPFDPELLGPLAALPAEPSLTAETLAAVRAAREAGIAPLADAAADLITAGIVTVTEHTAPGPEGAPDIALTIIAPGRRADVSGSAAAVYSIHGGGMVLDTRFDDNERLLDLVQRFGLVAATVEYRRAPEHPAPAAVEDCYAGMAWFAARAPDFGFDPARLVVMGGSAGGGLAAGVSLLARDRGGPQLAGQMLLCPMLDPDPQYPSAAQFDAVGTWQGDNNRFGWRSLLGADHDAVASSGQTRRGSLIPPEGQMARTSYVPSSRRYAAPALMTDLTKLPPAFIEVGAAELFRDEDVAYASRIWDTGGQAELHVWAGAYHGFDRIAPGAAVSRAALAARDSWLRRVIQV